MKIRFEWDEAKAKSNLKKHRVSFKIAAHIFANPFAMVNKTVLKTENIVGKL